MNIAEVLLSQAQIRPDVAAIIDGPAAHPRVTTFAELETASARAAGLLHGLGLRAGDSVLVLHPMSLELYVALIAIFRLGLVATFLDPSAGRAHVARCCTLQPPRAMLASTRAHMLRIVSPAVRRIPIKLTIGWRVPGATPFESFARMPPLTSVGAAHASPSRWGDEERAWRTDTPALMTFTSGSTGEPKAAVRTHAFLLAQHKVLQESLRLAPGQIDFATLPVFVLANLGSGVTSVIPDADLRRPGRITPGPLVHQLRVTRATRIAASPALLDRIARYCLQNALTLPGLDAVFTGGAPVFPRVLDRLARAAPNAAVTAVYGSTEAEPIAHVERREIAPEDRLAMAAGAGLLAGRPVAAIDVRVVVNRWGEPVPALSTNSFEELCVGAHTPGEIVVSGHHVLPGYLHGLGDQETKFNVEGVPWHRTGDAGYFDERGRVWLLGRCSARVEDARGTLYPFAVEAAASEHPHVRRTALVALRGRRVLAVEVERHVAPAAVLRELDQKLRWAALDEIRPLRQIPVDRRHNGKIDYPALQRMLSHS